MPETQTYRPLCPACRVPLVMDCAEWHRYRVVEYGPPDEHGERELIALDNAEYLTEVYDVGPALTCPRCSRELPVAEAIFEPRGEDGA